MKRAFQLLPLALAGLVISCDLIPVATEPETIESVEITPELLRMDALGETSELDAMVLTESGAEVEDGAVSWSSEDPGVATVSSSGTVTAIGNGTATIVAESDGVSATATVVVEQTIHSVSFSADSIVLNYVGATRTLQAVAEDSRGNPVVGAIFDWFSLAPDTVSVSGNGIVTGLRRGTARIIAMGPNGSADTIRVRVRSVPASVIVTPAQDTVLVTQSIALTAQVFDSVGAVIPYIAGETLTWSSSAPGVAVVVASGTPRVATVGGLAPGVTTITANAGTASGSALVTVQSVPVARVTLAPDSAVIYEDSTARFRATLYDSFNTNLSPVGRTITWTTPNPTLISIVSAGDSATVTGLAVGTALLIATSEGRADTARVRVRPPCPSSNITMGQSLAASLVTTDCAANGRYYDLWTLTVPADTALRITAAVTGQLGILHLMNSSGDTLATAQATASGGNARIERRLTAGTYTLAVTTSAAGATGGYSLSALLFPVTSVVIYPDSAVVPVGGSTAFHATLRESGGAVLDPSLRTITWTSLSPAIASVSSVGDSALVTANAVGLASLVARSEGRADTVRVRVVTACGGGNVTLPDTVAGTLATGDCISDNRFYDSWTFTLTQQTVVQAQLLSRTNVTEMQLTDAAGNVLKGWFDVALGPAPLLLDTLAAGSYRVVVFSNTLPTSGSYSLALTQPQPSMTIATARAQTPGTSVTVYGVITGGTGNFTDHSFYMQDGTGGIAVYRAAGSTAGTFSEGDSIRITGTIGTYLQEVEITGAVVITLLGTTSVPAPVSVTSTQLNAGQRQGELLQMVGGIVDSVSSAAGSTYDVFMHDASGAFVVQVDTLALIPRSTFQMGATYTITGIAGRANAVYHLQPRRASDVQQTAAANACATWQPVAIGQSPSGTLLATDCAPGDGYYYEGYRLTLTGTTSVTLTLTSTAFDAYLAVTTTSASNPADTNNWIAFDNNSAGGTNARVTTSLAAGTYVIWVTTNNVAQTGAYQLTVQ